MARLGRVQVHFTRQCRKKRGFLEKVEAQDLQYFVHAAFELVFFFDDGHQNIDADCDPHLRLHRVVRGPKERFDSQMLFDPFEE